MIKSSISLRVRAAPMSGESLSGYLLRLAELNGYPDPAWLISPFPLPGNEVDERRMHKLSHMAHVTQTTLADVLQPPAGLRSSDVGRQKVCVECIKLARWAPAVWDLKTFLVCPRHQIFLSDDCRNCGLDLSWRRPGIGRCRCGVDLQVPVACLVPPILIDLSSAICDIASGTAKPGLAPLSSFLDVSRLIWFIASDLATSQVGWRSMHMSKPAVRDIAGIVARAAPVVLDWPQGLHQWLGSKAQVNLGAGVRASFGPVLHRMSASLHEEAFSSLHAEVRWWL